MAKHAGFTWVEGLVIVFVLAFVFAILFPILSSGDRGKPEQTLCTSHLRRLAMATTMFTQDNNGHYPGMYRRGKDGSISTKMTGWASDLIEYVNQGNATGTNGISSKAMFLCPSQASADVDMPISYGYNAQLLRPDGLGITESQVKSPTQVGVLCDADPGLPFAGGGGVVGGCGLVLGAAEAKQHTVMPAPRHNKGCVIGYADGHAAICPDKFTIHDCTNGVTRAFFMAGALGLVDNPVAGLPDFVVQKCPATPITICGDACTAPLLRAACQAWLRKTRSVKCTTVFSGSLNTAAHQGNYLCGDGSGVAPQGHSFPIAQDALVAVCNKNTTVAFGAVDLTQTTPMLDARRNAVGITLANLQAIFNSDGQSLTRGSATQDFQVYACPPSDGTRRALKSRFGITIPDSAQGYRDIIGTGDPDIVDKVAGDPKGLGIVSAACADQKRVTILAIQDVAGKWHTFPNDAPRMDPGVYPTPPTWPFMRTLYVQCGGATWQADGSGIANVMFAPDGAGHDALLAGPMYQASYWR